MIMPETPNGDNSIDPMESTEDVDLDDEEQQVHDQLPSVEQARANAELEDPQKPPRRRCCICCAICTVLIGIVVFTVLGVAVSESNKMGRTYRFQEEAEGTLAPATHEERFEYVKDFLTGFSESKDLSKDGSPQNRAAKWIADEDVLHLSLDDDGFVERYALAVFYFAMDGPNWPQNLDFLGTKDTCSWFHIGFGSDDKPRYVGANCKETKKVQELFFPEKWLTGKLPDEMRLLKELRYVSIYRNPGISQDEFPEVFKNMPQLEYLALHFCDMKGTLPDWLGDMTSLTSLVLSNNALTGKVPSSIGELTELRQLFLDDNDLEGDIADLGSLSNLEALLLEDNRFYGNLDKSLINSWSNLEIMDLSHNKLVSSIPSNLFTQSKLAVIDLHNNELTGAIPAFTKSNDVMKFLGLHQNKLNGELPSTLSNLQKLTHLDLSDNLFTGTVPNTMESVSDLKYLFLSMNPFEKAEIPTFIQSLTKLEDLSLKDTKRTGKIPTWINNMSSLVLVDLDLNNLRGEIPDIGSMTNLKFLLLNRNELHGTIPHTIASLTNLDFLLLERNNFNGTAKPICDMEKSPPVFVADCAEMQCPCCTTCCTDDETKENCNDDVWLGGVDPIWETKYERAWYQFEKVKVPST